MKFCVTILEEKFCSKYDIFGNFIIIINLKGHEYIETIYLNGIFNSKTVHCCNYNSNF